VALPADNGAPVAAGAAAATPFIARNCRMCHNAVLKNAGLDFDAHPLPASLATSPEVWEKVVEKLQTRQMPPPPLPGPDPVESASLVRWIQRELDAVEAARPPNPGRVTARRLNRTEYDNTVRDLLGVTLRPGDAFPQDDSGYGFDNIGDVLSVSPVLLEKYLKAAERVSRAALFGPNPLKPPSDAENPKWENLSSNVGAQYLWVERVLAWDSNMKKFPIQLFHTSRPGTLDTSLISSDNINNPRTMNAVYDLPERMMAAVPAEWYMERKLSKPGIGLKFFAPEAFAEYVRCFNWKTIRGSCEDYRACATCDLEMDTADFRQGTKVTVPLLAVWGARSHTGIVHGDVLKVWKDYGNDVTGGPIDCGHYVPEEAPDETLGWFLKHFTA